MNPIASHLAAVQQRIDLACAKAGRPAHAVQLLAVSKTFGPDAVRQAHAAGQMAFGENYVQEALDKMAQLRDLPLQWHCIGPLQSNKTRAVAEHFAWVHSVDRLKTAQRLSAQRPAHLPALNVCLQVNIDGGAHKSGVAPQDALALAQAVRELPGLALRGVMAIPEPAHSQAAQLALHGQSAALFAQLQAALQLPQFDTLSVGMSADLEAAVHAGSTLVRVGTAVFGRR